MPISSPDGLTCFRWWCRFRDKTAENSERTAGATLFFVRQTVGGPGFPRGMGCRWLIIWLEKQRKQPERV
jgi:hypothetical protein